MMSTQEGSSTASANTEFPSATHLVTLPVPSSETATLLIAHTTEFGRTPSATAMSTSPTAKPALYIWCGESNGDVPALSSISAAQPPHGSSSLLEEANVVDRSDLTSDQASQDMNPAELAALELPPTGALTREWAVAMTSARAGGSDKAKTGMATSLFRSNSDLAKPMASRLCECSRWGLRGSTELTLVACASVSSPFPNSQTLRNPTAVSFAVAARASLGNHRGTVFRSRRWTCAASARRCARTRHQGLLGRFWEWLNSLKRTAARRVFHTTFVHQRKPSAVPSPLLMGV